MSTEIWKEKLTIEQNRRKKMTEAMDEYDRTVHWPARKALVERCRKETGHNWQFRDTNPVGYPIFVCSICGATEIRSDE